MKALRILSLFVLVVVAAFPAAAEPTNQLHPSNYVNDFAGVLDDAAEARLNSLAQQLDTKAKAQIAVVTVKSTDGRGTVDYAVDLYQKWGVGKKGTDRGVLILLAVQDRKYSFKVGYGLEPILPDGKVGGFGREAVPLLRAGDYSGAVSLMTTRVAQVIAADAGVTLEGVGASRPAPSTTQPPADKATVVIVLLVVAALVALVIWVASRRGGGGGGIAPRSGGGSGSDFVSGLLLGILADSLRNRGGRGGGGWGGGGFGGGGWGGGGGFGGFGGGSTGGGGADGSW